MRRRFREDFRFLIFKFQLAEPEIPKSRPKPSQRVEGNALHLGGEDSARPAVAPCLGVGIDGQSAICPFGSVQLA
jgi:hypothetical protein